jgi:hypothetical protein
MKQLVTIVSHTKTTKTEKNTITVSDKDSNSNEPIQQMHSTQDDLKEPEWKKQRVKNTEKEAKQVEKSKGKEKEKEKKKKT